MKKIESIKSIELESEIDPYKIAEDCGKIVQLISAKTHKGIVKTLVVLISTYCYKYVPEEKRIMFIDMIANEIKLHCNDLSENKI